MWLLPLLLIDFTNLRTCFAQVYGLRSSCAALGQSDRLRKDSGICTYSKISARMSLKDLLALAGMICNVKAAK